MKNNTGLYDKLGVDKNASAEEIKKAFREKAKANHADKVGYENHEKMQELNECYAILKNPVSRKRYDETGETKTEPFDLRFHQFINEVFLQIIEKEDVVHTDLIKCLREFIKEIIKSFEKDKLALNNTNQKYLKVIGRLKEKDKRIAGVLNVHIDGNKMKIAGIEDQIKFVKDVSEIVNDCSYTFDPAPKNEIHFGTGVSAASFHDIVFGNHR